ncbi:sulfotransferase [Thiohalobacter thiocyanaticus]|uniref:Sulfotransferase n=2 Tax=Thiohalobacter thiocyanaticus TaxID=585455 RepID=A0A426QH24_9GAMM|nr:sulfotransferase [Thiohalobacter thiocyanaticus]
MKPASLTFTKFTRKKLLPCFPLSSKQRLETERRLRGKEDYGKLLLSDAVIVSHEKSGRTWLRVMLSRFYQQRYRLPERKLLNFDRLHRLEPRVPVIFFTHDRQLGHYTGNWNNEELYRTAPVILLVRDPRDVAVSFYFDWKYRMSDHNRKLYFLPLDNISIYNFIMQSEFGLPAIIAFMNRWHGYIGRMENLHLFRYEDLRADTASELEKILRILGTDPQQEEIEDIVAYAEFEKMKQRELSGETGDSRICATDPDNPDSFKARRAKVGGYRDYFSKDEIRRIDELVGATLNPGYGY